MKIMQYLLFAGLFLPMAMQTVARETIHDFEIAPLLESEQAKQKLAGVRFYFGTQKHGKILKRFGTFGISRKTNAFGKSDQAACEWVLLSDLVYLRQKALEKGGNAVINIKSNYRNHLTSSNTTYQCGAGNVIAGVAIQGEIVKLQE